MLVLLSVPACAAAPQEPPADHHDDGLIGTTSAALSATDSVAMAVSQSCTTTAVKALATQLVEEMQCMRPGTFARIDNVPGLSLGAAVFPFLQTSAASALVAAQKARGVTMELNSGLRTLPQQYLLYRWYKTGRCGIGLAAQPGSSNHESALAVDIDSNASWRSAMAANGFAWLGSGDPVHFDYAGGGTANLSGMSVLAFQRLWNRNTPGDLLLEDGDYGPSTEDRLARAPVGGFAIGAICNKPDSGAPPPAAPTAAPPATGTPVASPEPVPAGPPSTQSATVNAAGEPPSEPSSSSCAASPRAAGSSPFALLALLALVLTRRRR